MPDSIRGSPQRAATACRVVHVDAVAQHPPGHRAVHRAGVEVAQPEPVGDAAGRARLARSGGAVDGDDDAAPGRPALFTTGEPTGGSPSPVDSRDASRCSARSSSTTQLDQADRAARVVVDADVLDVDLAVAGVGEQPGQLAGVVGHRDEDRRGSAGSGRRACRGSPGCRRRPPRAAPRRAARSAAPTASITASSRSRTSASRSSDRLGVGGDDLAVERRVAGRHPGHVADALPGQGQVVDRALRPAGRRPARPAGAGCARSARPRGRARPG